MVAENAAGYQQIALEFTKSLASREYENAYALTSHEYRIETSMEQLKNAFEEIVPPDWGPTEPIEVSQAMTAWPGKQASDLGWVYVSIYGDVYSEAVTVVVALDHGEARVREVEFGRP